MNKGLTHPVPHFYIVFSLPGKGLCDLLWSFCVRHHPLPSVVRRKLSHLNLVFWNHWTNLNQMWQGWSFGGSFSKLCPTTSPFKMAAITKHRNFFSCSLLLYLNELKNLLVRIKFYWSWAGGPVIIVRTAANLYWNAN